MGASEELEYLKSLVSQLNAKIAALESKAKPPPSPVQQLRTILMGPPGAGIFLPLYYEEIYNLNCLIRQRHPGSQHSR